MILSGPSCVGKSPLDRALARFHPDLHQQLQKLAALLERGDARRALLAFVDLLEGRVPGCAEKWEAALLA